MNNELTALQNAADSMNLDRMEVKEKYFDDKRKTGKKYYLTHNSTSISPVLDYSAMNHFILGMIRAKELITSYRDK